MWKQIGTKSPMSDRSLSNASSDRKYKRIRPYKGSPLDSPVLSPVETHDPRRPMSPQLALQQYTSEDPNNEHLVASHCIISKRDKQLLSIFNRSRNFCEVSGSRKVNSLFKMNGDLSQQMNMSTHLKEIIRSSSVKGLGINIDLTGTPRQKKDPFNIDPLQDSLLIQQQEVFEEIRRLKTQLQMARNFNRSLVALIGSYKDIYKDVKAAVKKELKKFSDMQDTFKTQIVLVMKEVTSKIQSKAYRHEQIQPVSLLDVPLVSKQESINKILTMVDQIKCRIARHSSVQPTSPTRKPPKLNSRPSHSPKYDKRVSFQLPSINQHREEQETVNG